MKTIRVLAVDVSSGKRFRGVEATWYWGAKVFRRHFDVVVLASSWDSILENCARASKAQGDIELHYWGHGAPGAPLVNDRPPPIHDWRWSAIGTVWFRCCDVFRGAKGADFARELAARGCRVVAHTVVIGAKYGAQSYLYGVRAYGHAWWPAVPVNGATLSHPLYPRTVMFWNQQIPDWAFGPRKKELPDER